MTADEITGRRLNALEAMKATWQRLTAWTASQPLHPHADAVKRGPAHATRAFSASGIFGSALNSKLD